MLFMRLPWTNAGLGLRILPVGVMVVAVCSDLRLRIVGKPVSLLRLLCCLLAALAIVGCSKEETAGKKSVRPRIITFSPGLGALVFDLGFGDHVVGVSGYTRLPAGVKRPIVGSAMSIRVEPILAVRPDVILIQTQEKYFEPVRKMKPELRIENFRFDKLDDIGEAMLRIGKIVGKEEVAEKAKKAFDRKLALIGKRVAGLPRRRVLFVLGYQNPLGAGRATFADEMIAASGGLNVMREGYFEWKQPTIEAILKMKPEVVICQSDENQKSTAAEYWRTVGGSKNSGRRVYVITDANWTIPAGHMADLVGRMAEMIHPELTQAGGQR